MIGWALFACWMVALVASAWGRARGRTDAIREGLAPKPQKIEITARNVIEFEGDDEGEEWKHAVGDPTVNCRCVPPHELHQPDRDEDRRSVEFLIESTKDRPA